MIKEITLILTFEEAELLAFMLTDVEPQELIDVYEKLVYALEPDEASLVTGYDILRGATYE
jgi:hypothetical protein